MTWLYVYKPQICILCDGVFNIKWTKYMYEENWSTETADIYRLQM